MRKVVVLLGAAIVGAFLFSMSTDYYLRHHSAEIDDTVTLVTLDTLVIVMKRGEPARVTRVRPSVTVPRDMQVDERPAAAGVKPAPITVRWTLPYSCTDVKWYASHFTPGQLEAMRKEAGLPTPNADQRAQIQACVAGRVK